MFSFKFSEIYKKTYSVEYARTDTWVKWTKKLAFTNSIHKKTPMMAPVLVKLVLQFFQKETPSQMLFYKDWEV